MALGQGLMGYSLHLAGELGDAKLQLEAALSQEYGGTVDDLHSAKISTVLDKALAAPIYALGSSAAKSALARTLWLQGHPAQAVQRVHQNVKDAARADHPVTLLVAITWGISIFLWNGDLEAAEEYIDRFASHAQSYSLGPSSTVALGFKGELAIRRGDARTGIKSLQDCLRELRATRHVLMITTFNIALAQGLATIGKSAEGMALVEETIQLVVMNGDYAYMPELLRLKGRFFQSITLPNDGGSEMYFRQSLDLSQRQGTRAWELRTAIDLAELLSSQGRFDDARGLLGPLLDTFTEDTDNRDLGAAKRLLTVLA
jgi:hypothetical protein